MNIFVNVIYLISVLLVPNECYYSRILDKADNVLYMYPNHAESIAEVDWCEDKEPCGVVTRRYWLPRMVIRPCRCKNLPCNTQYATDVMKINTVQLDNRSQFKMCDSGEAVEQPMRKCVYGASDIGVSVEEMRTPSDPTVQDLPGGELIERKVYVHCRCIHGYWQLSRHTLDKVNSTTEVVKNQYHCNRLTRCKKGDFCGHIRADTHSAYYRCSCPQGSLCISTNKTLRNASELLYEGPMYRAYCHPLPTHIEHQPDQE